MEAKPLAQTLHRLARADCNTDNIGRIILSEVHKTTRHPNLTFQDVQQLWREFYPKEEMDERCGVILVYFDGKDNVRNIRGLTPKTKPPTLEPMYGSQNFEHFKATPPPLYQKDAEPAEKPVDNILAAEGEDDTTPDYEDSEEEIEEF